MKLRARMGFRKILRASVGGDNDPVRSAQGGNKNPRSIVLRRQKESKYDPPAWSKSPKGGRDGPRSSVLLFAGRGKLADSKVSSYWQKKEKSGGAQLLFQCGGRVPDCEKGIPSKCAMKREESLGRKGILLEKL